MPLAYNSSNSSRKKRYVVTLCPVFHGKSLDAIYLTTKVVDICCYNQSSQVNICRTWNTRYPWLQTMDPNIAVENLLHSAIIWGINHITSSPLCPKSNGFMERMVQTVKNLLKKSDAAGQDPYLALLSYRTTPINSSLPSPAKVLNQRDYPTQLPCSGRLQRSQAMECNQEQLQHRQDVQKQQYDGKSPRELQKLVPGQEVSMFQPRTKT